MKWPLLIFIAITGLFVWVYSNTRDTDVSSSPKYGFTSFCGTAWRTKVKLAIGNLGGRAYLLDPIAFDKTHPHYSPPEDLHEFTVIPIDSRVRIDRLVQDNGSWGGVWVAGTVDDGTGVTKSVRLNTQLLAPNGFLDPGGSPSKTWDVNSDMLEK